MINRSKVAGWGVGVGIVFGLLIGFLIFHHPHNHQPPWFKNKSLSEAEKAQVKEIAVATFKPDEPLVRDLERRTDDLKKHLADPAATDDQLREEFTKIGELRGVLASHRFTLDLKVRKLVGPERIGIFDPLGPPMGPPPRPGHGPDEAMDHGPHDHGPREMRAHEPHDRPGDGPSDGPSDEPKESRDGR